MLSLKKISILLILTGFFVAAAVYLHQLKKPRQTDDNKRAVFNQPIALTEQIPTQKITQKPLSPVLATQQLNTAVVQKDLTQIQQNVPPFVQERRVNQLDSSSPNPAQKEPDRTQKESLPPLNEQDKQSQFASLILAVDKGDSEAQMQLGGMYLNQNKLDKAEHYLTLATQQGKASAHGALGILHMQQNKRDQAERDFLAAIEGGDVTSQLGLSLLYIQEGDLDKAEPHLIALTKQDNTDAFMLLGELYRQQKKFDESENSLMHATSDTDTNKATVAHLILGETYEYQNKFEQAEQQYMLAADKGNVEGYYGLSKLYEQQGKFDQAIDLLTHVAPGDSKAYHKLGNLYARPEIADLGKAEHYFTLAAQLGNKFAQKELELMQQTGLPNIPEDSKKSSDLTITWGGKKDKKKAKT